MFKWIFFDFDGTLVDSVPHLYRAYAAFLTHFNCQATPEEFSDINGPSLKEIIDLLTINHSLSEETSVLYTLYETLIKQAYETQITAFTDAESTLKKLTGKGFNLALVTASNQAYAGKFIEYNAWQVYFKKCIFADDISQAKPDPEIYLLALERTQANPEDVLVVEDSHHGISAAKKAGLSVVQIIRNNTEISVPTNPMIHSLHDIFSIMEQKT